MWMPRLVIVGGYWIGMYRETNNMDYKLHSRYYPKIYKEAVLSNLNTISIFHPSLMTAIAPLHNIDNNKFASEH